MTTLNDISQTEKVEYRTISRVWDVNVRATKERDKPKLRHRRRAAVTRGAGGGARGAQGPDAGRPKPGLGGGHAVRCAGDGSVHRAPGT